MAVGSLIHRTETATDVALFTWLVPVVLGGSLLADVGINRMLAWY
jgi:hypothetical protein